MTIVKLNSYKQETIWKLIFSFTGAFLTLLVVASGLLYSRAVGLQHEILSAESIIKSEKVLSAELKSQLFALTDPQIIDDIALQKGLVKDTNPQWVFVSL